MTRFTCCSLWDVYTVHVVGLLGYGEVDPGGGHTQKVMFLLNYMSKNPTITVIFFNPTSLFFILVKEVVWGKVVWVCNNRN